MNDTSMRGSRLGAVSYENDVNVEPAERLVVRYVCLKGHDTVVPFSTEAEEIPTAWECRCGLTADAVVRIERMSAPVEKAERHVRTHWDMLLERRSIPELEELLAERVALLHATPNGGEQTQHQPAA